MQFPFSSSYPLTGKERDRTRETSWSSSCYHYEFTNAQAAWRHIESTAAGFLSVFFILAFVTKTHFKYQCSCTTLNVLFYLLCPGICLPIKHLSFHTLFYFEWPSYNKQRKHADNTYVCERCQKFSISIPSDNPLKQSRPESEVFFTSCNERQWMKPARIKPKWMAVTRVTSNVGKKVSYCRLTEQNK